MIIWLVNPFSDLPHEEASEGRYFTLAKCLVEAGHEVVWWTCNFHHRTKRFRDKTPSPISRLKIVQIPVRSYRKNISVSRLSSHADYGKGFQNEGLKLIRQTGQPPDVIHMSMPPLDCVLPAVRLKQKFSCRVTGDLMDLWPETFERLLPGTPLFRRMLGSVIFLKYYRLARMAYSSFDGISAVSDEYLKGVTKRFPKQSTHLCYVGGRMTGKQSLDDEATDFPISFIYVGAISPTYDLLTILKAARLLRDSQRRFKVVFAGSGTNEPNLKRLSADYGLEKIVEFRGFLRADALNNELKAAHVGLNCVNEGTHITMPHKLSDYLCAGLAVINSIRGEAEKLLEESSSGVTYQAGKPDSLGDAMSSYLDNRALVGRHRNNARFLAATKFDRSFTYPRFCQWILRGKANGWKSHR